jgi:hypothetical protein
MWPRRAHRPYRCVHARQQQHTPAPHLAHAPTAPAFLTDIAPRASYSYSPRSGLFSPPPEASQSSRCFISTPISVSLLGSAPAGA